MTIHQLPFVFLVCRSSVFFFQRRTSLSILPFLVGCIKFYVPFNLVTPAIVWRQRPPEHTKHKQYNETLIKLAIWHLKTDLVGYLICKCDFLWNKSKPETPVTDFRGRELGRGEAQFVRGPDLSISNRSARSTFTNRNFSFLGRDFCCSLRKLLIELKNLSGLNLRYSIWKTVAFVNNVSQSAQCWL